MREVELARVAGDQVQAQRGDGYDEGLRRHRDQVVVGREQREGHARSASEHGPAGLALQCSESHQRAPFGVNRPCGRMRQDDHQQHEGDDVLVVGREVEAAEALGHADDQPADDGARDAAHAAEDDDHERLGDDQVAHARVDEVDRRVQRGGDGGECARDGEYQQGDARGVDADQRGAPRGSGPSP